MIPVQEMQDLARSGADSVFGYIDHTAEVVPGGIRWQTVGYQDQPLYSFMAFIGVAGICLFLADYARLTGSEKARELALGGANWCSIPEHKGYSRGLYTGKVGVGMAWLHLSQSTGDPSLLTHCAVHAEKIMTEDPGPVTDIIGGAAGNGLFLLRLWEASRQEQYRRGALRNGEWLRAQALRDGPGCYWPMDVHAEKPWHGLGFAHGVAGIAYFLLLLHEMQPEGSWADLAREALQTLSQQAMPIHGGLNWPKTLNEKTINACQWCHGAAGVGLAFAKAYEVLGETSFQETALAAGVTTFAYGDVCSNAIQCHGLAGNAELFIELYRLTQRSVWLERAYAFARRIFRYRRTGPSGDVWQGHAPGYDSPDFMCGAAGTGHFFLRLWKPDQLRMPLG